MPHNQFCSFHTLLRRFFLLHQVDQEKEKNDFDAFIVQNNPHGFRRCYHFSSDDSKHFKNNRHVLIASSHDGNASDDWANPSLCHLTSGVAASKDSAGNTSKNRDVFKKHHALSALGHLGGGTADNAGDAQVEIVKTFNEVMDLLSVSPDESIRELTHVCGAKRRPMNFGDLFHVNALIAKKA